MIYCSNPKCGKDITGQIYHSGERGLPFCCNCGHEPPECSLLPEQPSVGLPVQAANLEGLKVRELKAEKRIACSFPEDTQNIDTISQVVSKGATGQAVAPRMEGIRPIATPWGG